MTRMFRPGERPRVPAPGTAAGYSTTTRRPRKHRKRVCSSAPGGGSIFGPKLPGPRIASSAGNNMPSNAIRHAGDDRGPRLWPVARARSQVCTSVSLQSSRPIRSSSGIGAKRPDTGADARSGIGEREPGSRRSPHAHAADEVGVGRRRRRGARVETGGHVPVHATRRGPRDPARVHSVHGVGADHASAGMPTPARIEPGRDPCVALATLRRHANPIEDALGRHRRAKGRIGTLRRSCGCRGKPRWRSRLRSPSSRSSS